MVLARSDCDKAAASLEYDPRLLCIYVNGTELADGQQQSLEDVANVRVLPYEVFINRMMTTGMRHVARDKPLSARRAVPEGPLFFSYGWITHVLLPRYRPVF